MIRHRRRAISTAAAERFALEPVEPRILLDGVPAAVADAADKVQVVYVDDGELVVFEQVGQDGGQWREQRFGSWIDADVGEGTLSAATWRDPKDGRVYYALNSGPGLFVVLDDEDTLRESVRNITAEINAGGGAAEAITSRITAFTSLDGLVHVAGLTAGGDLVLYRQTGAVTGSGGAAEFSWEFINLSDEHLAPQGLATPAFTSDLTSYVTAWNGLNIAGLDAAGDVQSVWWSPGMDLWSTANLSDIAGAPAIAGNLTIYLTSWNGINIAGIDDAGNIVVAWWVPQFEGDWEITNFSDAFGGPSFVPGTIMAYTTPWGGLNVGAVEAGSGGGLTLFWWLPEFGGEWRIAADFVPGAEDFSGAGIFGFTSAAGTINLVGTNASGEVLRYHWRPGADWASSNLDDAALPHFDDYGGDDSPGIVADPALVPLSGYWNVTISNGFGPLGGDDGDGEPSGGTMFLRADGVFISPDDGGGLDFIGDTSGGTWTYNGSTVTFLLPEGATARAVGVGAAATQFLVRGITLPPSALQEMEQSLILFAQQFPEANLMEQIEAAGGLEAIFANIELLWVRV